MFAVAVTECERSPCPPGNSHIPTTGAAKSGALDAANQNVAAQLNEMTSIWPLFSELRGPLDEAFAMAQEGEQWVIPMLGGQTAKNLSTTLKKIIRRAGVEVWLKPFQNMRASR